MENTFKSRIEKASRFIQKKIGGPPEIGVILGSGLSPISSISKNKISIPYDQIPRFPQTGVEGHPGRLSWGSVGGRTVLFFEGRFHLYEGLPIDEVVFPVALLAGLGTRRLLLTSSAGGINPRYKPGEIMAIRDQINWTGTHPLIGRVSPAGTDRFVNLASIYSEPLQRLMTKVSKRAGIRVHRGVLAGVAGPVYETPAEIRMMGRMGADAVCMSMVQEAILAAYYKMETAGFCLIANSCVAKGIESLSHSDVVQSAERSLPSLRVFVKEFLTHWMKQKRDDL